MKIHKIMLFVFGIIASSFFVTHAEISDSDVLLFPHGFQKGVALSAFQNGGNKYGYSNWSYFENQWVPFNVKRVFAPAIKNGQKVGIAADFWNRAFDDIQLIKDLGCNAHRFSIEWSEVETEPGVFNENMLAFYESYCQELLGQGIEPMITLYHFVHPRWFDKIGGFEKAKNIPLFVDYCKVVFERLSPYVRYWNTINEPTVVAACGYVLGIHPPGKCFKFSLAGRVLNNLLNAHVAVYKELKSMQNGQLCSIGMVHQMLQAESFDESKASNFFVGKMRHYLGVPLASFLNKTFCHSVVKEFLKTGHFEYHIPGFAHISDFNADAPESYDFVGLNFYSKVVVGPNPTCYADQVMTDMDYPSNPESLYDAIVEMSELKKPIYITENGIADAADTKRAEFIKGYLSEVHRALRDGYDVRGYYYWTLLDNFEWDEGYDMQFGLYHVNYDTQHRTLREGALPFRDQFQVASA